MFGALADIVVFHSGAQFSVLPALGNGRFETYRSYPGLGGEVVSADFNGDGLADFASASAAGVAVVPSNP